MKIFKIVFLFSLFLIKNNLLAMKKKGFVSETTFNNIKTIEDVLMHSQDAIVQSVEKKSAQKESEINYTFKCYNSLHTHTHIKSFTVTDNEITSVIQSNKMRTSTGFICEMVLVTSILGIIASLDEPVHSFIVGLFN